MDNKYFKTIAPVVISIIIGLCSNAIFSFDIGSSKFVFSSIILVLSIIIDLCLVIHYISKEQSENKVICESEEEIKNTMKKIIKTPGKICVMSRDLSWVDVEIEACITAKANSMLVFAEKETELTQRLQNNGVDVKYYGALKFEPKTRFTVIRYNANHPQVAIADPKYSINKNGKLKHTIYQTSKGEGADDWITSLSMDMIQLCKIVCNGAKK